MRSEKYDQTSAFTFEHDGGIQYDVAYIYDLAGNIVQMKHRETGCGVGGTNSLDRNFKYDPLYRLLEATGRENSPTSWFPGWEDAYRSTDNSITTAYRQKYAYDKLGNIQTLQHIGNNNFTRNFGYSSTENKLNSITVGSDTYTFDYDVKGNLIQENSNRFFGWDYADRMRTFADQAGTAQPTKYTHYLYDAAGERVKKITRKSSTLYEVTVYIDCMFEYIYKYDGTDKNEEHNELHIMDDKSRIAMVRAGYDDGTPAVKYVLDDHLGSSSVIVDGSGIFYNKEEYYPFGETSFGSFAKKRYRYVSNEHDNESGLYYYGARYYASWTCKFISTDPLASTYHWQSPYVNAANNPIKFVDVLGLGPDDPQNGSTRNVDGVAQTYSSELGDWVVDNLNMTIGEINQAITLLMESLPTLKTNGATTVRIDFEFEGGGSSLASRVSIVNAGIQLEANGSYTFELYNGKTFDVASHGKVGIILAEAGYANGLRYNSSERKLTGFTNGGVGVLGIYATLEYTTKNGLKFDFDIGMKVKLGMITFSAMANTVWMGGKEGNYGFDIAFNNTQNNYYAVEARKREMEKQANAPKVIGVTYQRMLVSYENKITVSDRIFWEKQVWDEPSYYPAGTPQYENPQNFPYIKYHYYKTVKSNIYDK